MDRAGNECTWCGDGETTRGERAGTLSPWVCDYCLIGLIVLISRDDDGSADAPAAVLERLALRIDACG